MVMITRDVLQKKGVRHEIGRGFAISENLLSASVFYKMLRTAVPCHARRTRASYLGFRAIEPNGFRRG